MEMERILGAVGAILFTSDRPVPKDRIQLALTAELGENAIPWDEVLDTLATRFGSLGIDLRESYGGYQLVTQATYAPQVRKFLEAKPFRLGRSTLETLAIIAYRQPITRAEVDSIRGMESPHLIRTLIERGLVKMSGKADAPGRPVQYSTTDKFLETVGLTSLQHLPPLSELEELQGHTEDKLEEGLSHFISEASAVQEQLFDAEAEIAQSIDTLLSSVATPEDEVYPSRAHAEVARENRDAVKQFQQSSRGWRRKRSTPEVIPETFS